MNASVYFTLKLVGNREPNARLDFTSYAAGYNANECPLLNPYLRVKPNNHRVSIDFFILKTNSIVKMTPSNYQD